jgi:anti-sigma B factor antagonist
VSSPNNSTVNFECDPLDGYNLPRLLAQVKESAVAMELEIATEQDGSSCMLTLTGEVDVYTAPQLKAQLVELIEGGCSNVVVNMESVSFIDSSGLGVLVSALRRARERDGIVRIVCTRENILKIFRITGLDKVFPIFADAAEAQRF